MMKIKKFIVLMLMLTLSSPLFARILTNYVNGLLTMEGDINAFLDDGSVVLSITKSEMKDCGYKLGDTVDIRFSNGFYLLNIPFLDGVYVNTGEAVLLSTSDSTNLTLNIKSASVKNIGRLKFDDKAIVSMNKQSGAYNLQFNSAVSYATNRSDYESDESFANFRMVNIAAIKKNRLYRSSSPIDNTYNRAFYANKLAKDAGIKGVLNLSDSFSDIIDFSKMNYFDNAFYMSLYNSGDVIALKADTNFKSDDFARDITLGIAAIVRNKLKTPLLFHSTEGRIRSGFACALVEALMGATYQEIVSDYMQSYKNYKYSTTANQMRYNLVVDNYINDILLTICSINDINSIKKVNMKKCARDFLETHGMSGREIDELISMLSR